MKKSIAVLGLGKYGMSLAHALSDLGVDVLAVDKEEALVKEAAEFCTAAICAELIKEENLKTLGLKDMDVVVVAIGRNLEASIISVMVSKELGVPTVVAKSTSDRMTSILQRIGADKVIMPEEYAGKRSATILASQSALDYFQVDKNLCMVEMKPLEDWIGKSLIELNMRNSFEINVVAVKESENCWSLASPDKPLQEGNKLLVVLEEQNLHRLID